MFICDAGTLVNAGWSEGDFPVQIMKARVFFLKWRIFRRDGIFKMRRMLFSFRKPVQVEFGRRFLFFFWTSVESARFGRSKSFSPFHPVLLAFF